MEWNESDSDDESGSESGSDSSSSTDSDVEEHTGVGADNESTNTKVGAEQQEGVEYIADASDDDDLDNDGLPGEINAADALMMEEVIIADEDGEERLVTQEQAEALRKQQAAAREELHKKARAFMGVSKDSARTGEDVFSTPLPGETLRTFYDRTKEYWAQKAHSSGQSQKRGKKLRRDGFTMAEAKYDEYKPLLEDVEKIQAEARLDATGARDRARPGGIAGGGPGIDSRNRR